VAVDWQEPTYVATYVSPLQYCLLSVICGDHVTSKVLADVTGFASVKVNLWTRNMKLTSVVTDAHRVTRALCHKYVECHC